MSEFKVSSRYAKSVIDLARERNVLDAVHADMLQIIEVLKQNTQLQAVLQNPIIKLDRKENILKEIFGKSANPLLVSFFSMLVKKGRAGVLYSTAKEFITQYNVDRGIIEASVTSASPLSKEHYDQIVALIKQDYGKEVILSNKVEPDLIGGFILTIGDRQIDTSIAGKLNKLEQHFKNK